MINWVALSVFIFFFLLVTVLGFVAARWRRGDLNTDLRLDAQVLVGVQAK